jgi:hypothetical protein
MGANKGKRRMVISSSDSDSKLEMEEKRWDTSLRKVTSRDSASSSTNIQIYIKRYKQEDDPCKMVSYFLEDFEKLRNQLDEETKQPGYKGEKRSSVRAQRALSNYRYLVNGSETMYGQVPGVSEGQKLVYRAQISLICLLRPYMKEIDYTYLKPKQLKDNNGLAACSSRVKGIPVAISVVNAVREHRFPYGNKAGLNWIWYKSQCNDNETGEDKKPALENVALLNSFNCTLFASYAPRKTTCLCMMGSMT